MKTMCIGLIVNRQLAIHLTLQCMHNDMYTERRPDFSASAEILVLVN